MIGKRSGISAAERPALTAGLYGAAHMFVDLASISALYAALGAGPGLPGWAAALILSYDFIAFASQMFIGHLLDRLRLTGAAAAAGCMLTAAGAWLVPPFPIAGVVLAALGNALFHVGGGAACLRLDRGRALWAGIFVAPGAIGLFLGKLLGGTALYQPWALTLLLAAGALACLMIRQPRGAEALPFPNVRGLGLVAAALLLTVFVRSLVGFSVAYPWVKGWQQAVFLTLAVFAGKALGGALGDRLGWRALSVAGLIASAPLLAFGSGIPELALLGLLCFNFTMAITLAGLAYLLPGHEGLAFGLTAAAIVAGQTPAVIPPWMPALGSPYAVAACILLSAAALWFALGGIEKHAKGAVLHAGRDGAAVS
jgi:FSR family fosmidomycin resistance protein-like MFS transporter